MIQFLLHLDESILLWIQDTLRSDVLTPAMVFFTCLGNKGMLWILISLVLMCFSKTRKAGIMSITALAFAFLVDNMILKPLFGRMRPYEVIKGLHCIVGKQPNFSFPSGHTGSSFASAVVLYQELPQKYGKWLLAAAFLMGFTRLYVGVHYPSDVLGGAIIGTLLGIFTVKAYQSSN